MSDLPDRSHAGERERESQALASVPPEQTGALRALIERLILSWRLFWDERVGFWPRLIPLLAVAYLLIPIELAPELVLGPLGMADDAGVLLVALALFAEVCPPDVVQEHLREIRGRRAAPSPPPEEDVIEGTAEVIEE